MRHVFLLIRGFHTSESPIKHAPMQILMPEMDSTGQITPIFIIKYCVASKKLEIFIFEKPQIILLLLLHILLYSRT